MAVRTHQAVTQLSLPGFAQLPGMSCQLSSLRMVLHHGGFRLSEPLLLGLSSGLGFVYWSMKALPSPLITGLDARGGDLFVRALERLWGSAKY